MQIAAAIRVSFAASCLALGCADPEGPTGENPFASSTAASATDEGGETTTSTNGTSITDAGEETSDPVTTTTSATTMPSDESSTTEPDATGESSESSSSSGQVSAEVTGESSSESNGESGDTFNDGTVDVVVSIQSMWAEGECDDVTVTNVSDALVMWEIELMLPGTVYQLWNAELTEMDGIGTFVGVDFNAALDPGEAAMFGFCVTY